MFKFCQYISFVCLNSNCSGCWSYSLQSTDQSTSLESILHLLGFVETVDFIDEQDGLPLAQSQLILRLLDHLSDVVGGSAGGRQSDETSRSLLFAGTGNDVSQSGLKEDKSSQLIKKNIQCIFWASLLRLLPPRP